MNKQTSFSWERYCNPKNKIAINVTSQDEEDRLLDLLREHDCHWCDDKDFKIEDGCAFEMCGPLACYANNGTYEERIFFAIKGFEIYALNEVLKESKLLIQNWFD